MKKKIDWFWWIVYSAGIGVILLIIALCAVSMKVSSLSHENELLIAQKETLESAVRHVHCNSGRFKYDPITGSIYDNETKEIYRKVEDPLSELDDYDPTTGNIYDNKTGDIVERIVPQRKVNDER